MGIFKGRDYREENQTPEFFTGVAGDGSKIIAQVSTSVGECVNEIKAGRFGSGDNVRSIRQFKVNGDDVVVNVLGSGTDESLRPTKIVLEYRSIDLSMRSAGAVSFLTKGLEIASSELGLSATLLTYKATEISTEKNQTEDF